MRATILVLLALAVPSLGKRTYTLTEKPMLKSPTVQKADGRICAFDDTLNYVCFEHSADVKVGWDIKQRWELAYELTPPATYVADDINDESYNHLNTINNVRYKYTWKIIPYVVSSLNFRPNAKLDRIIQAESQLNVDQFKLSFYFAVVYYQLAVKYSYLTPLPVAATVDVPA